MTDMADLLRGSLLLRLLARMRSNDWSYWSEEDVDSTDVSLPGVPFRLAASRRLGIKRTNVEVKVCAVCGSEVDLVKCGICLVTYYCGPVCQKHDWKEHKISCLPPEPRVQNYNAIAVPDFVATRQYVDYAGSNGQAQGMALIVLNSEYFTSVFGTDATLRTLVSLAHSGRPHRYIINVTSR